MKLLQIMINFDPKSDSKETMKIVKEAKKSIASLPFIKEFSAFESNEGSVWYYINTLSAHNRDCLMYFLEGYFRHLPMTVTIGDV